MHLADPVWFVLNSDRPNANYSFATIEYKKEPPGRRSDLKWPTIWHPVSQRYLCYSCNNTLRHPQHWVSNRCSCIISQKTRSHWAMHWAYSNMPLRTGRVPCGRWNGVGCRTSTSVLHYYYGSPRDPPGLEFTITALFSLLGKNTVIEKMVSGYHVIVRVFVGTVSIYRVFVTFRYYTVFTSHNDLSFFLSHICTRTSTGIAYCY